MPRKPRKPVKPRKKQPLYIRGRICSILPMRFVAELAGMTYWSTYRLLNRWAKENKIALEQMTVADLKRFLVYAESVDRAGEGEIDDYIHV